MLRWTGIACALAACYHPSPVAPCSVSCETDVDCPNGLSCGTDSRCFSDTPCFLLPDAGSDGEAGMRVCLGHWDAFHPCVDSSVNSVTLMGPIDTGRDERCIITQQAAGPDLCAIVGNNVTVRDIAVTGTRPLAIVALQAIDIVGEIDVASHLHGSAGPHALGVTCTGGAPGGIGNGGGGGAGGSFHGTGGNGGLGSAGGATRGLAPDTVLPASLDGIRAGCAGNSGGLNGGSPGGFGGGALAIVAGERISIASSGSINASGAAPDAPTAKGGGGGGGAGGMVLLDSVFIDVGGSVVASGASGASGAGTTGTGAAGSEPVVSMPGTPAPGTPGTNGGGSSGAGNGLLYDGKGGMDGATTAGGGGGGGGGGYIVFSGSVVNSTMIAPPPIHKP